MTIDEILKFHAGCYVANLTCEVDGCFGVVAAWVQNYGEGPHLCVAHRDELIAAGLTGDADGEDEEEADPIVTFRHAVAEAHMNALEWSILNGDDGVR